MTAKKKKTAPATSENSEASVAALAKSAFFELLKNKSSIFNRNSDSKAAALAKTVQPEEKLSKRQINKRLFDAAATANLADAEKWLSMGADINFPGIRGMTPLAVAISNLDAKTAEFLLAKGADPSARLPEDQHILFAARWRANGDAADTFSDIVKIVFDNKKGLPRKDDVTLFEQWGNMAVLSELIDRGFDVEPVSMLKAAARDAIGGGSERAARLLDKIPNISEALASLDSELSERAARKDYVSVANPLLFDVLVADEVPAAILFIEKGLAAGLARDKWMVSRETYAGRRAVGTRLDQLFVENRPVPFLAVAAALGASRICHTLGRVAPLAEDLRKASTQTLKGLYLSNEFSGETIVAVMESGFDLSTPDSDGNNFLHHAFARGVGRGVIETVLRRNPGIESKKNKKGQDPLTYLAEANSNKRWKRSHELSIDRWESIISSMRMKSDTPKKGLAVSAKKKSSPSL